ncbi:MAG: ATP-binding protein [Methylotenera sp.]
MSLLNFPINAYQNFARSNNAPLQTRAINILNVFRFLLSLVFIFSYLYVSKEHAELNDYSPLFLKLSVIYLIFSILILLSSPLENTPRFFLPLQIIADIVFIILFMYAAGGIGSGLGLLLIIIIVTASLVSNGRLALFYAAVATIGLLLEQSYQIFLGDLAVTSYTQSVMLSLSCFATAWLAYTLAERMLRSEELASARGLDLENLAQVNALITQEMQDGVIVVDKDLNIRHRNLQAESLLLLSPDNTEILSLINNAPSIASIFSNWVKGDELNQNLIVSIAGRELKLRFKPISDSRSSGAVIFIQDWSQIQSTAQQAKLAALGRLTANIAHEIRNPLSAISHANQLLQEEEQLSQPTQRILEIIASNIGRIDQIIKDVLELNRRDRTQKEKIDLQQFLADFYTQFCSIEKIPTTHFQFKPCLAEYYTSFDHRHLTQILWNLCKNGWEHSQKQAGSLGLNCVALNGVDINGINIEISDDGSGVTEQYRARLFEPFFTTKTTGNGLGLYISRELAEANGANLQYQALPVGSAFILSLKRHNSA